ncbi:ubiquitin carboxyl-terminal hydrolase 17-like [Actinidia eriantha]|uniref:ubiquitin carboxyl-terminal hydrolase 17-like n=1 Tax=Actinidia eriantha TaxID=165200 RepID=UPI002589F9A2|nr:ubiquitin carboxyl-terminal hydrolase 17-like [Actinidia eriantha]
MPVGGDLGFSYLVLVVSLVGPVVALVLRRKWRFSVARREEIKRLLVLASEEAARAELEASTYVTSAVAAVISRPLQYQCAVCFCPTTTRCARCKAVRYCSGKCQIIHWRQGHNEECHPFTISHQINRAGAGSNQKVLKQEDDKIYDKSSESEARQCANSVQNFPKEHARSNSNSSRETFCGNDDGEVECISDEKGTTAILHGTERSDRHQSTYLSAETNCVNVDQNGPPSSNSVNRLTNSGKLYQIKPNSTNHDIQYGSTRSSGWSADVTNESSFSEPSTPSSGFWEGTINSRKPKIDTLGDCGKSSSIETGDGSMHNSRSSPRFSFNYDGSVVPSVDVQSSDTTALTSDGARSTTLGIKMPIDRVISSEETNDGISKGRNSPLSIPEKSNQTDVYITSDSPVSKSKEPRWTSSSANTYPTSSAGGPLVSMHAAKISSTQTLSLERSNHVVNGMRTTSRPLESKEGGSLLSSASVAQLSSSTRRHSLQDGKSGKDDGTRAVRTSSSECGTYSPNAGNGLKTSMRKVVDQLRASKSSRNYQSGVGSEGAGRYNNKGLFPYELFVKLYNQNKIELRPCGLVNCGNSCYANAVLQCLACTPPLTAYLLQGLHSKACERRGWCFTCEFESLILKAKEGTSPLSPIGILSQIQNIGSNLGSGREEDAHEFLRYAIDTMQSVCLKEAGVNASGSLEEETTLIGLTFGGYLRSKIKCLKCGGKSERHERMMDLTVEIGGDIGTLEEALRQFTSTEILDGENKYECSRCRSYERAKKKLTILEAPNILTIALKRFQSGKFGKLNKSIRFPEILDLTRCMSGTSDKSPIYRLYGVVVHLDVMNAAFSGHYVCYVKTIQNKWFKIDDSTVKAVELESVLTKGAYILLYARCSPRAPKMTRNSIVPCDPINLKSPTFESRSQPCDFSRADPANGLTGIECLYSNHKSFQPIQTILEEGYSSDHSSFFSEECSNCSTDSSNRDSSSAEDYFDLVFGDVGRNWSNLCRNSPDSDSSSSSSSFSPFPLHSRHSSVSNSQTRNGESGPDDRDSSARVPSRSGNWEGKSRVPFLHSDSTKHCRKLASSGICRETNSGWLGLANPFDDKKSRVSFSRSTRERTY